ncbi:MucR family transcriptional regulator [Kordiimonas sp. SCSIO 12610]|uniref:MucR family transcriptional regulator n=1 Tax=Kordiimonas sp. SCSIO 12610 TaxID=2829597 RepID=UPI00210B5D39|nr:MucR family transcriptional regulator [Kordiimonas sp. SCSIO 12610]UTW54126.1 MucR family transcriptional regulator [Kordiimonas sp. SCSIO 12610]
MSESIGNEQDQDEILGLVTDIVTAYVSNNTVSAVELPSVIKSVYSTLSILDVSENQNKPAKPPVPIKKSYTDDYIICLEDGKKLKMLKRYLRSRYDMTPEEYRSKWGLPENYPMVAPNYAAKRSEFAKQIGLGKRGKKSS